MWPKPRLVLLTLIALTTTPLYAHDIYSGLTTKRGASCCDDHDCRPAHYRMTSAGVEMLVLGKWLPSENTRSNIARWRATQEKQVALIGAVKEAPPPGLVPASNPTKEAPPPGA